MENPPEKKAPLLTGRPQEFWEISCGPRKDSHYRNQWLGGDFLMCSVVVLFLFTLPKTNIAPQIDGFQ